MPTLSIITVNLNNRDGLQSTIDSVLSQTFTDYEWIVIDGDSTDGSRELIEQYSDRFSYWVSEPDKGIYNAMNKGIAQAHGEWLQFLNSGDWLYEDTTLEKVFSDSHDADILYGNVVSVDGNNHKTITFEPELSFSKLYYDTICHQGSFIRGHLFHDTQYNEELSIVSDWAFFLIQAYKGSSFYHLNDFIAFSDATGISNQERELLLKERLNVIEHSIPCCMKHDMEQLNIYNKYFSDGQLNKINTIRNKNRFFHKLVTAFIYVMQLLERFC